MGHFLLGAVQVLLVVQTTQATITGVVRDAETGAALAGAIVALTDLDRAAATDADGRYTLRQVPAGPNHISARLVGYAPRALHALVPSDGELEINVSLRPQPLRLETVHVHAPVSVRGLEAGDSTSFPDRETSIAAVRNHPLLAEPDAFQGLGGGEVVLSPESPTGVHIRGGASDQTAYLLDGIPVFNPYHATGLSSALNPDALSWMRLSSSTPSEAYPHSLSGSIEAVTRAPGTRLRAQGSASTTQARLTLDGPLAATGVGYVVSLRSGLHEIIAPKDQNSYLQGGTGDWLAKLEAPAFGGQARLLGYGNGNEINATAAPAAGSRRNLFEWQSRSLGAEWRRDFASTAVRVVSWSATGDAGSAWATPNAGVEMAARRRDEGVSASVERRSARATTVADLRFERSRTSYRIEPDSAAGPSLRLVAETPVATALARHERAVGRRTEVVLGSSLALSDGNLYLGGRAQLRWKATERVTFSGGYARAHQFAQSLRNAESVVGNIFPVDVTVGVGAPGVPVARSDQVVIAADCRPASGLRFGLQAYERGSDGLVLVAPRDGGPFTTGGFAVGSGASRGISADLAVSSARYGVVASYGLQRVRLEYGDSSYVPEHGATHLLEGGVIVFPTATISIRLGTAAAFGRRTTTFHGGLEWESCNLLDRGCEFLGSPDYEGEALGAARLPPYFRVDIGLRKHWHLDLGGRDAQIALFGTATNILGRRNLLTYARDPVTGERLGIEMRPTAPLVVGLDWRF